MLSVDEACTNVIEHAYAYNSAGQITVSCTLNGEKFTVTIEDNGAPFDPTTIPEPNVNQGLDERKAGGLGIYFMNDGIPQEILQMKIVMWNITLKEPECLLLLLFCIPFYTMETI